MVGGGGVGGKGSGGGIQFSVVKVQVMTIHSIFIANQGSIADSDWHAAQTVRPSQSLIVNSRPGFEVAMDSNCARSKMYRLKRESATLVFKNPKAR